MKRSFADLWLVIAAAILVEAAFTYSGFSPWLTRHEFMDSDCYMRIQRVMNLYNNGRWYDSFEPRSNAPFGEQLHWTRPLDIILFVGAWIGSAVTDFRTALWNWGAFVSPALLLVGLWVWRWGLRLITGTGEYVLSCGMLLLSPMFTMAFMIGRPDHHSLIALCLLGAFACLIRLLSGDERLRVAFYGGLWAGLGLWVSKELLIGISVVGTALAIIWIWRGGKEAAFLARFGQGLSLALMIALPVEYPPANWLHVRYARFTLVDVVFAIACALPWTVVARVTATRALTRLWWTLTAGAATIAMIALTYPRFLLGPTQDFTPAVVAWLRTIGEFSSLWPTDREHTAQFLLHLGPTMIAIGWCLCELALRKSRRKAVAVALLTGNLVFLPLSLSAMRWAVSSNLMAALPWALAVSGCWNWNKRLSLAGQEVRVGLPLAGALLGGPVLIAAALGPGPMQAARTAPDIRPSALHSASGCDWKPISVYLSDRWPKGGVLLSYLFAGGELIWRTPFGIVAAPYGNDSSLRDTTAFFSGTNDAVAREIVARRHVDLVLICPGSAEGALFESKAANTLHRRLTLGETPSWLEKLPLPPPLNGQYLLFHPTLSNDGFSTAGSR